MVNAAPGLPSRAAAPRIEPLLLQPGLSAVARPGPPPDRWGGIARYGFDGDPSGRGQVLSFAVREFDASLPGHGAAPEARSPCHPGALRTTPRDHVHHHRGQDRKSVV